MNTLVSQAALPALVLAAGLSTRMGAFKPLLELGGQTLIHRVLGALRDSGAIGSILVVTGHRAGEVAAALAGLPVQTVFNPDYEKGEMLSSVRTGLRALPEAPGFLLAMADQPAVASSTIRALAAGFQERKPPLVIPVYAGRRGHPVVISQALQGEIAALGPQDTLRTVVQRHLAQAMLLGVKDRFVVEDLDTPEDFAQARRRYQDS